MYEKEGTYRIIYNNINRKEMFPYNTEKQTQELNIKV